MPRSIYDDALKYVGLLNAAKVEKPTPDAESTTVLSVLPSLNVEH